MSLNRRQFVDRSVQMLAGAASFLAGSGMYAASLAEQGAQDLELRDRSIQLQISTADELQRALFQHGESNLVLKLPPGIKLTCPVREDKVGDETSPHPLLVPKGVSLDLNGSTLLLDCRSNCYGVRLSSDSAIRNGTIKVTASQNKGSQSCWHSCVSVGAAYGDGGTTTKPGYFSTVKNWAIENLTVDQPFAASAIQLMSEACHGLIKNIRILDSPRALLGIGMDWGSVGSMTSEDGEIPRMRTLFERGEIYSTHPHDILIENIRVGKLTRNVDGNDAGVRCSACHNITIRNIAVEEAATAVAIFGGDLGYEFARDDQRQAAHQKYVIEDVMIGKAHLFGLAFNGLADNVWRSTRSHGYKPVRDPVAPGLNRPVVRHVQLNGLGPDSKAQGIYAVSLTQGVFDDIRIAHFNIGAHVEDWVDGMSFHRTEFEDNKSDKRIEGATVPAVHVEFHD